ncbi:MAG: bifunctional biotin--[acetyl-CoA-carboxylase] ligase/biotin operon repressor BirA [Methylococcales bacterium]|nr:bifunctional biotin--[acetyl-CoA-carboxylase] ligase/biotin operon repressor BirA [Methylococcales bacterium]
MQISDTLKRLLILLADGKFHSGTELAAALGVSRSAIWKQLQALNELDAELIAVSGKGYKLPRAMQMLDAAAIVGRLSQPARQWLAGLEIHDVIASTSGYLQERAAAGAASGLVCAAEYQTAGKGRRGRAWVSPFGHNLYLSLLWRYQDSPAALAGLSLALGVAVIRALKAFGIDEVGLKWPNDIYWRQRKLAGILVEVSGENGGPCHAVVGLGVNFYLSEQQGQNIGQPYADIQSILGESVHLRRNELLGLLLNQLLPVVASYQAGSLAGYLDEWRQYDCVAGRQVQVQVGETRHSGILHGINDEGLLLLRHEDGRLQTFASGEVSLRTA